MLTLLAAINSLLTPYWNTKIKYLGKKGLASLTIIHSPNIIGHTVGIAILISTGLFILPTKLNFFSFWLALVIVAAMQLTLNLKGLIKSNFFGVQIVGNLGFVVSSILAVFFIGEHLSLLQYFAICMAVIGVALFVWPKNTKLDLGGIDSGIAFVFLSVILGGFSSVLYKMAALNTSSYPMLMTGRFIGDLVAWTIVWLISLVWLKRSPLSEINNLMHEKEGLLMIAGVSSTSLLSSYLIYKLPVTSLSILGTLGIITSYFISTYKYKDALSVRMIIGAFCVIFSIGVFFVF